MIIKDKTIYLNYVNDVKSKIANILKNIEQASLTDTTKEKIRINCLKIDAITSLIELHANSPRLIPNIEWLGWQKDIDDLFNEMLLSKRMLE